MTVRTFDFGALIAGGTMTIVMVKEIDVSRWTEGVLNVRVHGGAFDSSMTASIVVALYSVSPTMEDPGQVYADTTAAASVTIDDDAANGAPLLLTDALTSGFGNKLCLKIMATQESGSPITTMNADISVELAVKAS